ncbi:unnamed protein product [Caenorhabditis auriculariae]|uniref:Uncharacterized protein n=1 Tax=Caenorhabditis auriculariae TaxID=2777116 RepID=A0A8S1HN09_9PELO|nr:unnamed protein product [Caenorhabditis auriculariae]
MTRPVQIDSKAEASVSPSQLRDVSELKKPPSEKGSERNKIQHNRRKFSRGGAEKKPPSSNNERRSRSKNSKSQDSYKAPPLNERPQHPGFEAPVSASEQNKTCNQLQNVIDSPDFV